LTEKSVDTKIHFFSKCPLIKKVSFKKSNSCSWVVLMWKILP
jgi:hypothetical protein